MTEQLKKRVLVDADGCMLNWEYAFHVWMEQSGHDPVVTDAGKFFDIVDQYGLTDEKVVHLVTQFNNSAAIGFLPPLRDAMHYIKLLHEKHGFVFHCVSSVSDDKNVAKLREMNLKKLFGDTVFEHVECLAIGSSKKGYLENFYGSGLYWIEDNIKNAEAGLEVGLKPLLMEHGYNLGYSNPKIPVVKSWNEIYQLLVNGEVTERDFTFNYMPKADGLRTI